jgi:hypothetical protein
MTGVESEENNSDQANKAVVAMIDAAFAKVMNLPLISMMRPLSRSRSMVDLPGGAYWAMMEEMSCRARMGQDHHIAARRGPNAGSRAEKRDKPGETGT